MRLCQTAVIKRCIMIAIILISIMIFALWLCMGFPTKIYPEYKLSWSQKLFAILIYPKWLFTPPELRKDWHLVLKGAEKHKCNFTLPMKYKGVDFLKCEHLGCNMCEPLDEF